MHIPLSTGGTGLTRLFPPPRYLSMPGVGVDISDSSVKFLELLFPGRANALGRFGEIPIPDGIVVKGKIERPDALAPILKELRTKHRLEYVRASLPEEHAFVFQTQVPEGTESDQLRTILEFQLEEHVPLAPREAIFDYELMSGAPEGVRAVDVSVYPKAIIDTYYSVFRDAGLLPLSFEVEARALARAVMITGDPATALLVDFGKIRTGIAVMSRGFLEFTTTIPIGGASLSTAIVEYLKVPVSDVDRLKNERGLIGMRDNRELFLTLMSTVSVLKDEINKHLMYWNTRKDERGATMPRIEKIILSGGSANLAGLPEYLSGSLRIPVELGNVWRNVFSFDDVIPELERPHSLSYATAVGLALRSSQEL